MAEKFVLGICLTDGLGEQRHEYSSKKEAMRRYRTLIGMLSHGGFRAEGPKVRFAYIDQPNGKRIWLKKK